MENYQKDGEDDTPYSPDDIDAFERLTGVDFLGLISNPEHSCVLDTGRRDLRVVPPATDRVRSRSRIAFAPGSVALLLFAAGAIAGIAITRHSLNSELVAIRSKSEVLSSELTRTSSELVASREAAEQASQEVRNWRNGYLLTPEERQGQFIFASVPGRYDAKPTHPTAVQFFNHFFPCLLTWKVGDTVSANRETLFHGTATRELPTGEAVSISLEPIRTRNWLQPFFISKRRDGKVIERLGTALGKAVVAIQEDEEVIITIEQPIPPWNAELVSIKDEWGLVVLENPSLGANLQKWLDGTWLIEDPTREELPNCIMFFARDGVSGVAKELTAAFVAERSKEKSIGVRGKTHTSLYAFASQDGVSTTMRTITKEELEPRIAEALHRLLARTDTVGNRIGDQIEVARQILRERNIPVADE